MTVLQRNPVVISHDPEVIRFFQQLRKKAAKNRQSEGFYASRVPLIAAPYDVLCECTFLMLLHLDSQGRCQDRRMNRHTHTTKANGKRLETTFQIIESSFITLH